MIPSIGSQARNRMCELSVNRWCWQPWSWKPSLYLEKKSYKPLWSGKKELMQEKENWIGRDTRRVRCPGSHVKKMPQGGGCDDLCQMLLTDRKVSSAPEEHLQWSDRANSPVKMSSTENAVEKQGYKWQAAFVVTAFLRYNWHTMNSSYLRYTVSGICWHMYKHMKPSAKSV